MKRAWSASSASHPRRSPTISPSWATRPTVTQAYRDGDRSRQRQSWRASAISNTSLRTGASGTRTPPTRRDSPKHSPRNMKKALLFRDLATLRSDLPLFTKVDELKWTGPTPDFAAMAAQLEHGHSGKPPPSERSDSEARTEARQEKSPAAYRASAAIASEPRERSETGLSAFLRRPVERVSA